MVEQFQNNKKKPMIKPNLNGSGANIWAAQSSIFFNLAKQKCSRRRKTQYMER